MMRRMTLVAAVAVLVGAVLPVYAVAQDVTIDLRIAPRVLFLASNVRMVTIHAGVAYADVAFYTVTVNGVEVDVARDKADLCGNLVIKLRKSDVADVVTPGRMPVVVAGETTDGTTFMGGGDLIVKEKTRQSRRRKTQ